MKLNKIKNIIKKALSEQIGPTGNNGRKIRMLPCPGNTTPMNQITWNSFSVNGNIPVVGDKVDLTNVPFISNVGYWKVVEVGPATASCTHPANQNGVCDLPTHNDPCGGTDPGSDTKCTEKDFQYNATPCGQTWLVPAPGGAGSWQPWLTAQWNAYSTGITQTGQPVECFQFGAIITWITDQLNQGTNAAGVPFNQTQIDRKTAKRDWAVCMADHCDCKIDTSYGDDTFRCLNGQCVSVGGPGGQYLTLQDCINDGCEDPDRPCEQFNAAPVTMQNGCCGKCINGVYTGMAGDPCDQLTQSCKCCPDDSGGEERGCLDPNATNAGQCCPQNNYPGCVPTIQYDECCEYDGGDDPCKTFYSLPQAQQDGCCEKCQGNISPADPCYQYCKCCDPDPSGDPCRDNPNESCFWCFQETSQGGPCIPVGGNLGYALANGFTLYSTQAACNAAEPGCRPDDRDPGLIECHKCDELGYPVGNMFPGPNCPPGWTPIAQFNPEDCKPRGGGPTDPSDPVDIVDPGMQRMRDLMEYKKPK